MLNKPAYTVNLRPDLSVVMGTLNRRRLLQRTIQSIRENDFAGTLEIIVVDGGSSDGTCDWLARQRDILSIVQPNYKTRLPNGQLKRAHSWGEFINLGFRAAVAPWVLMVSDDLLLCRGAINTALSVLQQKSAEGQQIGGGAIFFREYPRDEDYHVKLLPGGVVHINHGFYSKAALETVGYADSEAFDFYGADGDLTMRLNAAGLKTVALEGCYAEHLQHRTNVWTKLRKRRNQTSAEADMDLFQKRWGIYDTGEAIAVKRRWSDPEKTGRAFWKVSPLSCAEGMLKRLILKAG